MDELNDREQSSRGRPVDTTVHTATDPSGAVVATINGEVDLANVAEVRASIEAAAPPGTERLVLDLGGLTFLDSSGLSMLLAVARNVGAITLRRPTTAVQRIVELTGLDELLPTEP